jgi:tight adherence protein B
MIETILQPVAAGLAATGVALFVLGLGAASRRRELDRRMRAHIEGGAPSALPKPGRDEVKLPAEDRLTAGMNRRLTRSSVGAMVRPRLVRAGLALTPSQFILIQIATAALAALVGQLALRSVGGPAPLVAAAVLGIAGFAAPLLALGYLQRKRQAAFERQLPQAIDSMAATLQAGSGLPQAMEIIARETSAPLGVEFRRTLREMELGLSLTDSLANLFDRVPSDDLVLLQSAISLQQRVGGDLATVLKTLSHTIRERLRIRSEIRVLTAQGRYSAYVITALPFLMFVYLWFANNEYISQLLQPGLTRIMLVGALAGMGLGYYSMKKIVSIEV